MENTTNPEAKMTEYETLLQQIKDAQQLQYNAVMMRDRSSTISRLDSLLDELFARKAKMNQGR